MKNMDMVFVVLAYLAETKNGKAFAMSWLAENYGPIMNELHGVRKAAKKAIGRINGKWLNPEDIVAMEAAFLDKLGLYGAKEGDTRQFEDRVYVFESGKWEFDCLVNPHILTVKDIDRIVGDTDGDIDAPLKNEQYPFITQDPVKFVNELLRENARTHRT